MISSATPGLATHRSLRRPGGWGLARVLFAACISLTVILACPARAGTTGEWPGTHELWRAEQGIAVQPQAQAWLSHLADDVAHPPAGCSATHLPAFEPNTRSGAWQVEIPPQTGDRAPQVLVVQDPVMQHALMVWWDDAGCPQWTLAGRQHPAHSTYAGPLPNVRMSAHPGRPYALVVLQDNKTLRPWLLVQTEDRFQREFTLQWMGLAVLTLANLASLVGTIGFAGYLRRTLLVSYLAYLTTVLFWTWEYFGAVEALFPALAHSSSFTQRYSLATGLTVFAIGWVALTYSPISGSIRKAIRMAVIASMLAAAVQPWWHGGYLLAIGLFGLIALVTTGLVLRRMRDPDLPTRLFSVGLIPVTVLGFLQALSVVHWNPALPRYICFAFSLGLTLQSVLWLAAFTLTVMRERNALVGRLRHEALSDPLTGLANRRGLLERLQREGERHSPALLFLDLDRFKVINDSQGHAVGDQLLMAIGRRMHELAEELGGVAARFGGDEFVFWLGAPQNHTSLSRVAERVINRIGEPVRLNDQRELQTTATVGAVLLESSRTSVDDALRDADTAMYVAKVRGEGYRIFEPAMREAADRRFQMESGLPAALAQGQLVLHYQPLVQLQTGQHAGFEALVRWQHPELGLLPPAEFIRIAEETGHIIDLGREVARLALTQLGTWKRAGLWAPETHLAFNLSAGQFGDGEFVPLLETLSGREGLAVSDWSVELTESAAGLGAMSGSTLLTALRARGVRLLLDDFGTGESALAQLAGSAFSGIKIDRSFVAPLAAPGHDDALVRALLLFARELGLTVIAEGIEVESQLRQLRLLGCQYGQGYLFSRPLPAHAATAWLEALARSDRNVH